MRRHFLDDFAFLFFLVAPASVGIGLLATTITSLFLGQQWLASANLVWLCAFYTLFDAVAHFCQPLFFVMHRERRFVHVFTAVLAVRVPAVILGAYVYGVDGAAFAMMTTALLNLVLWMQSVAPMIDLSIGDVAKGVWRTLTGICVMSAVVLWTSTQWSPPYEWSAALQRFGALCMLGAIIQYAWQSITWMLSSTPPGPEATALRIARLGLRRLFFFVHRRMFRRAHAAG